MDREQTGRRVTAARALAGMRNTEDLAGRIDENGLGVRTLRRIENGTRDLEPRERLTIARACGIDESFFTVDFTRPLTADAPFSEVVDRLDRIEAAIDRNATVLEALSSLEAFADLAAPDDAAAPPSAPDTPAAPSATQAPRVRAR